MGGGDPQLGGCFGAFLAGSFLFSEIIRPFSKKSLLGVWEPKHMVPHVLPYMAPQNVLETRMIAK